MQKSAAEFSAKATLKKETLLKAASKRETLFEHFGLQERYGHNPPRLLTAAQAIHTLEYEHTYIVYICRVCEIPI